MTQPKRGLGRGLDALLSGTSAAPPPDAAQREPAPPAEPESLRPPDIGTRGGLEQVDIDLITPNPEQPRTNFQPEQLRELADSIKEHGIIQPLIVSREADGTYQLVAGERRLQAARLAGLQHVPVVVREVADSEYLELAIVENVQRADLNPVEEAQAFRRLIDEYGLTQEEVAQRVGKSRAAVANALRLLQLESEIRRSLVAQEITEGHARALLSLPEGPPRLAALRDIVKRRLSVRETEAYVRRQLAASPKTATAPGATTARRDATLADVESRLRRALGTRVAVSPYRNGGARINIDCYGAEEFASVVAKLLGEEG